MKRSNPRSPSKAKNINQGQTRAEGESAGDYSGIDMTVIESIYPPHSAKGSCFTPCRVFNSDILSSVPVFDARKMPFSMDKLDKIGRLPLYKGNITSGSAIMVAYTLFYVVKPANQDGNVPPPLMTCGLQWVVLLELANGIRNA